MGEMPVTHLAVVAAERMETPELDVTVCLRHVRAGDEMAARQLIAHLTPLVTKIVRSHLPRRTSEEDLMQAVFIKVFTRLDQYRGEVPLTHWVSRVAVNTCLNEISREKVRPELRHADLSEDEEAVLQNLAANTADLPAEQSVASRELVEKMLAKLNPEDRLVVTLLHLEGRSVEEVRAATGWSTPLVKVRAFRARLKMKKHLEQLMKESRP
jgi:RNA polymerase sigma-70 factor (ECF subfamily)